VVAAPAHHKVIFENDRLRVLEVTLEPNDEEPVHHHRWPSVFVLDAVKPPIHDYAPDGTQLPPNRDVVRAIDSWDGKGCLIVHMAPQPAGRVFNGSDQTLATTASSAGSQVDGSRLEGSFAIDVLHIGLDRYLCIAV
jgi:hypothetical protein